MEVVPGLSYTTDVDKTAVKVLIIGAKLHLQNCWGYAVKYRTFKVKRSRSALTTN